MDCLGCLCCDLCIKLCFGLYEAGNGHGIRFHKVEPMCVEWAAHGCSVFGTIKNNPDWLELDQKRQCVVCMKLLK